MPVHHQDASGAEPVSIIAASASGLVNVSARQARASFDALVTDSPNLDCPHTWNRLPPNATNVADGLQGGRRTDQGCRQPAVPRSLSLANPVIEGITHPTVDAAASLVAAACRGVRLSCSHSAREGRHKERRGHGEIQEVCRGVGESNLGV
jgi:hypothetical protein